MPRALDPGPLPVSPVRGVGAAGLGAACSPAACRLRALLAHCVGTGLAQRMSTFFFVLDKATALCSRRQSLEEVQHLGPVTMSDEHRLVSGQLLLPLRHEAPSLPQLGL